MGAIPLSWPIFKTVSAFQKDMALLKSFGL
jgi:hypothetical protein